MTVLRQKNNALIEAARRHQGGMFTIQAGAVFAREEIFAFQGAAAQNIALAQITLFDVSNDWLRCLNANARWQEIHLLGCIEPLDLALLKALVAHPRLSTLIMRDCLIDGPSIKAVLVRPAAHATLALTIAIEDISISLMLPAAAQEKPCTVNHASHRVTMVEMRELLRNEQLQNLDLVGNSLSLSAIHTLITPHAAIHLQCVSLGGLSFKADPALRLAAIQLIGANYLRKFSLVRAGLTDAEIPILVEVLLKSDLLMDLNLDFNAITVTGIKEFLRLKGHQYSIEQVSFLGNPVMRDPTESTMMVLWEIEQMLRENINNHARLSRYIEKGLFNFYAKVTLTPPMMEPLLNRVETSLRLQNCHILEPTLLAMLLSKKTTLCDIFLESCIAINGKSLSPLYQHSGLTALTLCGVPLTRADVMVICQNLTLTQLALQRTFVSMDILEELLEKNRHLKKFEIQYNFKINGKQLNNQAFVKKLAALPLESLSLPMERIRWRNLAPLLGHSSLTFLNFVPPSLTPTANDSLIRNQLLKTMEENKNKNHETVPMTEKILHVLKARGVHHLYLAEQQFSENLSRKIFVQDRAGQDYPLDFAEANIASGKKMNDLWVYLKLWTIKKITLTTLGLDDESATVLAKIGTLQKIDLSGNCISAMGVSELAAHSTLRGLNISCNTPKDKKKCVLTISVGKRLAHQTSLTALNFSGVKLERFDVVDEILQSGTIKKLCLSSFFTCEKFKNLLSAQTVIQRLAIQQVPGAEVKLDVQGFRPKEAAASHLMCLLEALQANTHLLVLSFTHCDLSESDVFSGLQTYVASTHFLRQLIIGGSSQIQVGQQARLKQSVELNNSSRLNLTFLTVALDSVTRPIVQNGVLSELAAKGKIKTYFHQIATLAVIRSRYQKETPLCAALPTELLVLIAFQIGEKLNVNQCLLEKINGDVGAINIREMSTSRLTEQLKETITGFQPSVDKQAKKQLSATTIFFNQKNSKNVLFEKEDSGKKKKRRISP